MSTPYNPNHTPDPDDDQTGTSSDLTGDTSATSDSETSSTNETSSTGDTSSTNETGSFGAHSDQAESQSSYPSYGQYPSVQPQHGENQYGQQSYTQPQYGQGQYGQQAQYGQFPQAGTQQYDQSQYGYGKPAKSGKGNGFFNALFDLSFSRYITVDFMRVIYAISLGLIVLAWVAGLLFSFAGFGDSFGEGMLMLVGFLIFGTLAAFIAVVVTRITLEFYVSLVKTAQNTSKLVELEESAQRSTTQR
ncbi:DUF4282 domain-containing protein [Corynebacterium wankanglinii]|uniref:DUF4282 domain-containing protein n=1 Tax=Corynebacterium wankanglinii TaxID=2735136 RepID=A0A838CHN5_9CORY|nr:DUF4282 domain-containing protein [Corynebacterium wankanglinii]MBA1834524.1 DUF4282 domain-containing protein [Corynebacterium wankanglinii]